MHAIDTCPPEPGSTSTEYSQEAQRDPSPPPYTHSPRPKRAADYERTHASRKGEDTRGVARAEGPEGEPRRAPVPCMASNTCRSPSHTRRPHSAGRGRAASAWRACNRGRGKGSLTCPVLPPVARKRNIILFINPFVAQTCKCITVTCVQLQMQYFPTRGVASCSGQSEPRQNFASPFRSVRLFEKYRRFFFLGG